LAGDWNGSVVGRRLRPEGNGMGGYYRHEVKGRYRSLIEAAVTIR
jgi:hypothetical protein